MQADYVLPLDWVRLIITRCSSRREEPYCCGRHHYKKGMSCGSCSNISRSNSIARRLGRKWKRQAQFSRIVESPSLDYGNSCVPDRRRRQLLARVCNFFLEEHEQGCSRKMAEISEYLRDTQTADTESVISQEEIHDRAMAGLGFKDAAGKKNMIVKVCDFFLDKKERGNEINIRAIITAIDQANSTAGLSLAERKAVEEKQRELLVKVCKILLDTKERGVETNIQEIWNAIRYTKLNDPTVYDKMDDMNIQTSIEYEDNPDKNLRESEMKKRKMVIYKFFLDPRERGMEDKTKQINMMLSIGSSQVKGT